MSFSFEQGPIRPPSEAKSLLIRVTRNCPWNRCTFCHIYEGEKFEIRPLDDTKEDIRKARAIADEIKEISWKLGEGGEVSERVVATIYRNDGVYNDSFRGIAAWLYFGGESVFLQDANSLVMKTENLVEILEFTRKNFPGVKRITSYCRSKTAKRKSAEELKMLFNAGLSRIHIGMESGYDPLLNFIKKGVSATEHIEGGRKIVEAGISLSEYIMPGLGGEKWSCEHATETARVINEINPDFVRLRSLIIRRNTDLYRLSEEGKFDPLGEEDVVREIRLFINRLEGIESTILSYHIYNLLEEVKGKLPGDKKRLLAIIDRYLGLNDEDRLIYRLGRRRGVYGKIDDLKDKRTYNKLRNLQR